MNIEFRRRNPAAVHPFQAQVVTFDAEFPQAVNSPELQANFLLAIRDDSLATLDRFKGRIPNLFPVDFYDSGDIVKAVAKLNRLSVGTGRGTGASKESAGVGGG